MKKNLYFRSVYKSSQALEEAVLGSTLRLLSFPRTLLEVFIRKNMGERFFSIGTATLLLIVLAAFPIVFGPQLQALSALSDTGRNSLGDYNSMREMNAVMEARNFGGSSRGFDWGYFFLHHFTWYLFLGAFYYFALERYKEIKRLPSVFDFGRSSVDPGEIHPRFQDFKWKNQSVDIRMIETVLEPLFFFVIGVILIILKQMLGYLIVLSSIGYWMNYRIAYFQGDQFIMDTIDEMLFSQEKANAFIADKDPKETNGVRYYGRKPADPDTRRKVADMFEEDDSIEVD
ncbi:hypothetical protein [Emticicia agri]|uniref:Uncharacterized protein n=1 Tax=Emticicia agri TaxID=2492393 RepID=A0A4V1ZCH5_9BACT|nr:hypothetical protein [Emticicia agri]RYU92680.1 hypothetical protein EWM59_25955 [Emticicia agri]